MGWQGTRPQTQGITGTVAAPLVGRVVWLGDLTERAEWEEELVVRPFKAPVVSDVKAGHDIGP